MRQTLPACINVTNVISYTISYTDRFKVQYHDGMKTSCQSVLSALEDDISELKCEEGRMPLLVRPLTVVTHSKPKCWREPRLQCSSYYSKNLAWSIHKNVYFSSDVPKIFSSPDTLIYHLCFGTSQTF